MRDDIVAAGYAKRPSVPLDALDGEWVTVLMDAIEGLVAAPPGQA